MNRLRRSLILLGISLVVTLIALVFRTLTALGVFTEVTPTQGETCIALKGIEGPEDLQVDRQDGLVFVSATDRRALDKTPNPKDGLYTFVADHPEQGLAKLTGTPRNFHPHGISLYRDGNGNLTLMAINHPVGEDSAVEIFSVKVANGAATLTETASITGGELVSPNDVAAVGPDQFYATNDHGSKSGVGRFMEDVLLLPRANVVYFDGNVFRVVADDLNFANGIQVSPDANHVYVASTTGRAIHTYERSPVSGSLKDVGTLDIASGLDNIDVDEKGRLWVAGHPKLLQMQSVRSDASKVTPSQVFVVSVVNGVPAAANLIFADDGHRVNGVSIGASWKNRLFMGGPLDNKVTDCLLR
jgi:arylesterase/paraoxonase